MLRKNNVWNTNLKVYPLWVVCFLLICSHTFAQYKVCGYVRDKHSREALPFASITYTQEGRGVFADINGYFSLETSLALKTLEVSHLGYIKRKIELRAYDSVQEIEILLRAERRKIEEVVITPRENPALRLLKRSLARHNENNPALLERYTYLNYSKLRASLKIDSSSLSPEKDEPKFERYGDSSNRVMFFVSESLVRHDHARGKLPVEVVLSTHTSGFKNPRILYLASFLQPLSFYDSDITLLGMEYANPYSLAGLKNYRYRMGDTLVRKAGDTVFQIHFVPRYPDDKQLAGEIVIGAQTLALERISLVGRNNLMSLFGFELHHRYREDLTSGRWFPDELYMSLVELETKLQIESITTVRDIQTEAVPPLQHSRQVAIAYAPVTRTIRDSLLTLHKIEDLSPIENKTYQIVDSLGAAHHFDKWLDFAEVLASGRLKLGYVQFVLSRLFAYNRREGYRLGVGVETSNNLSSWFRFGGYFAYGFRDREIKYGGYVNFNLERAHGQELSFKYSNDLRKVGELQQRFVGEALSALPLNSLYLWNMDRVQEVGTTWTVLLPLTLQLGVSYVKNYNYSGWGYPSRALLPYDLLTTRVGYSYAPYEQYAYFPSGLRSFRLSPIRLQAQIEYGVHVGHWDDQFAKFEGMFLGNWRSVRFGHVTLAIRGGYILGNNPLAYGFSNRGIGTKLEWTLVDGESFATLPSDTYYHDLYSYLHLLYNTMPWGKVHLGKNIKVGLLSMINAGWGRQLRNYAQYGQERPEMKDGVIEVGLGISAFLGSSLPTYWSIIATYRALPYEGFQYKRNVGIGLSLNF